MHSRGTWPKMHQEKSPKLPQMLISPELVEGDFLHIDWYTFLYDGADSQMLGINKMESFNNVTRE